MLRLFLVRHAKAELATGRDDYKRKLTDRGRADARRMARALAARRMLPDLLIHSGAARAKETAEILAAGWSGKVELHEERRLYNASQDSLFARARALPDSRKRVGLVGHNPGLGELAITLACAGADPELGRMAAKFPTCAVTALDFTVRHWRDIERNSGALALFVTPAELEADAG